MVSVTYSLCVSETLNMRWMPLAAGLFLAASVSLLLLYYHGRYHGRYPYYSNFREDASHPHAEIPTRAAVPVNMKCIEARHLTVKFPMCLYDASADNIVSKTIIKSGGKMYEHKEVSMLFDILGKNSWGECGLIDVGANVGTYTLPAAHLGYHVLSVEMSPRTFSILGESVRRGHIDDGRVMLINAAISNKRALGMRVLEQTGNIGNSMLVEEKECRDGVTGKQKFKCRDEDTVDTITMDDLVKDVNFSCAALKIDIQGAEIQAFQNATELFDLIDIKLIMIEWDIIRAKINSKSTSRKEMDYIDYVVSFFLTRGYLPYDTKRKPLPVDVPSKWSYNVFFMKKNTKL